MLLYVVYTITIHYAYVYAVLQFTNVKILVIVDPIFYVT